MWRWASSGNKLKNRSKAPVFRGYSLSKKPHCVIAMGLQPTDKVRFSLSKRALNISRREKDEATSLLIF